MRISIVLLSTLLFLFSCSSEIEVHGDHVALDSFMKEKYVYLNGSFEDSFFFEGEKGDSLYLVGVSEGASSSDQSFILTSAEKNVREKFLDYIGNDSITKTKDFRSSQNNYREITSSLDSKSSVKGIVFSKLEKITKCLSKQRPMLDLTLEALTECRVRYKFPLAMVYGSYEYKN